MKICSGDSPVFLAVGLSVKGGENLKADAIRSLLALRTSFYESPNGQQFSRVQLLTIGNLLEGKARRRICFNPTQRTYRWATTSAGRGGGAGVENKIRAMRWPKIRA